ncbi:MAG: hypothetical protein WBP54_13580 [Pelodictyon phaeoclathratiforme]
MLRRPGFEISQAPFRIYSISRSLADRHGMSSEGNNLDCKRYP